MDYTNIWTSHKFTQTYLRTSRSLSRPKRIPSKIDSQPLGSIFSITSTDISLSPVKANRVSIHLVARRWNERVFFFWERERMINAHRTAQGFTHIRLNVLILTANTNIWVKSVSKDHSVLCRKWGLEVQWDLGEGAPGTIGAFQTEYCYPYASTVTGSLRKTIVGNRKPAEVRGHAVPRHRIKVSGEELWGNYVASRRLLQLNWGQLSKFECITH